MPTTALPVRDAAAPAYAPPSARLRAHGVVFVALLRNNWIEARRYALNTAMQLVLSYVLFLTVFLGVRASGGDRLLRGETLPAIVVGLTVWLLALRAFRGVSGRLSSEASQGTLEQLAMSPLGLTRVLIYQSLAQLTVQLVQVLVLLYVMMATTGRWMNVRLESVLPLLLLTVAGAMGLGFAMGGLALVFKRVTAVFQAFQYVFIALVAIPPDAHPVVRWLPLSWGAALIRRVMVEGVPAWRLPAVDLLVLGANSALYLALGLGAFKLLERRARTLGLLGHY